MAYLPSSFASASVWLFRGDWTCHLIENDTIKKIWCLAAYDVGLVKEKQVIGIFSIKHDVQISTEVISMRGKQQATENGCPRLCVWLNTNVRNVYNDKYK